MEKPCQGQGAGCSKTGLDYKEIEESRRNEQKPSEGNEINFDEEMLKAAKSKEQANWRKC